MHIFKKSKIKKIKKRQVNIDEKLHVFEDLYFGRIWGGFGKDFAKPKSSILVVFSSFVRDEFCNVS